MDNAAKASVTEQPEPKKRRKRARFWLWLVFLLACAGGWWWWHTAHLPYRVLAQVPSLEGILRSRDSGVLIALNSDYCGETDPVPVAFYSWDGKKQWEANLPPVDRAGWKDSVYTRTLRIIDVSSNGHNLALAIAIKNQLAIMNWHDGRFLGQVTFPLITGTPLDGSSMCRIIALDDGRVLAWMPYGKVSPVWFIQGSTVLAVGQHQTQLNWNHNEYYERHCNIDGTIIGGNIRLKGQHDPNPKKTYPNLECVTMTTKGHAVVFSHHFFSTTGGDMLNLMKDGSCVQPWNNSFVNTSGIVTTTGTWHTVFCPYTGDYVVQHDNITEATRIFQPNTGKTWALPNNVDIFDPVISANGHFCVVEAIDNTNNIPDIPALPWIHDRLADIKSHDRLEIYANPMRLYSRIPLSTYKDHAYININFKRYRIIPMITISSDGRHLILVVTDDEHVKSTRVIFLELRPIKGK